MLFLIKLLYKEKINYTFYVDFKNVQFIAGDVSGYMFMNQHMQK